VKNHEFQHLELFVQCVYRSYSPSVLIRHADPRTMIADRLSGTIAYGLASIIMLRIRLR
jgi:hypothetical protein